MAMSNLVHYAFVWQEGKTIVVYDIKVGRYSQINGYMKLYEYQKSRSFIDLHPRSLRFNIFKLLFLRNRWDGIMKVSTNGLCHVTKMAAMSIYESLDGGVWNSLISKSLAHCSLSLKFLLIL